MPKDTTAMLSTLRASARVSQRSSAPIKVSAKKLVAMASTSRLVTKSDSEGSLDTCSTPDIAACSEVKLDSLEEDTMGRSWYDALRPQFKREYFIKLKTFLKTETSSHEVYPPLRDVYSWSRLTPLESVKVVILGQDPYHNVGQAHGLAFSVLPPTKLPGSLKNIYKQIASDIPSFKPPKTGDFTPLAKLGVLWLNSSLTVRAHKAASHSGKGWETFTAEVIRAVVSREDGRGVVFLAWGLPAQKTLAKIGIDETKHLILRSPHPSPLSAHRGFLGNGHFSKANAWLCDQYGPGEEVDWTVLHSSPQ
ncbi:hypothetical protein HGRIS_013626 [Hohenbuehelia grisea]|uniref:Uracil-DNA glycosylase n=1 Tax=Hohenbuehelia grisea TaxID=104357 RepID=A0ABR3IWB3_9AGAR